MPYQHERAGYRGLHHFVEHHHTSAWHTWHPDLHTAQALPSPLACIPSAWHPQTIVAIDGSVVPVSLPHHRLVTVGAWTVSALTIDWQKLQSYDQHRPVDPITMRGCTHDATFAGVLPSGIVCDATEQTAPTMFRQYLPKLLSITQLSDAHETLLDTYATLYHHRIAQTRHQRCPWWYVGCCQRLSSLTMPQCPCMEHRPLYSTDALRLHESYTRQGMTMTVWNETMRVLEHLWLLHHIRTMVAQKRWEQLATTVWMMDGPLALFGSAGWLSRAIRTELRAIQHDSSSHTMSELLILGIEKTGAFVDGFATLDSITPLPPMTLIPVDDAFIASYRIRRQSQRQYGRNTYYGQKYLYKTSTGQRIVFTIADTHTPQQTVHPRLADALATIEATRSVQYPNGLLPIVMVHAEVALAKTATTQILQSIVQ